MTDLASDVVIRIQPRGSHHLLSFERMYDRQITEIALRSLTERASMLRHRIPSLLDPLRDHIGIVEMELDSHEAMRAIAHLDRLAYGFLEILLEDSGQMASDVISKLHDFLMPVFLTAAHGEYPIFEVEGSQADQIAWQLPLEFLPIAPVLGPSQSVRDQLDRFLGFRAEIIRLMRGGPSSLRRGAAGSPEVHLFAHIGRSTPPGIAHQIAFLQEVVGVKKWWPGSTPIRDAFEGAADLAGELVSIFSRVNSAEVAAIVHFSCHYRASGATPNGSINTEPALDFGECVDGSDLLIRVFDLRAEFARQRQTATQPVPMFVFLNACQTASANRSSDGLLAFFQRNGVSAVIGTETWLPDRLAAQFAINLYTSLFRGQRLGRATVEARRRLLERFRNPVGLFYTLLGNPLIQAKGI
ncbi:CHAT domain-containing protein [Rhizobium leguminosarum]|uniref:CHAT domain-containing protein n=1 Tax=Rhizobium leguminosarum TaxID=384 RepID=UPI0024A95395|nr:CHAT domain-containing protein [Rhizobium leguminosarum]MDI5929027.1 CHAT domain-containing protein [Rhizobium leguminosarum]